MRFLIYHVTLAFVFTVVLSLEACAGKPRASNGKSSRLDSQVENEPSQAQELSLTDRWLGARARTEALNAQKRSIYHIRHLWSLIKRYKLEHGKTPNSLDDLAPYYSTPDGLGKYLLDGWGRSFYYSATGSDFTLLCFGRDGVPTPPPVTWPGGRTGYTGCFDFDADIIMINGQWAQTPYGLGR